jgi:DnaJ-class molecular chaperone
MAETFYSVLGVERDADTARIKEAYREKVKTHHPDVSDESDAAEQFQRITEARDILVDDAARKRYDRLGHAAYINRHLDSNAWSATASGSQRTRRGDRNKGSGRSANSERTRANGSSGDASRSRSGSRAGTGGSRSGGGSRSSERRTSRTRDRASSRSERTRSTTTGSEDRAAWMGEDGWSTASGASASGTAGQNRRARTEGWKKQHAASNVYSPTGRDTGIGSEAPQSRFARLARGIGPWIVFHFVFLVSAFVTIYLLMSWSPTIPTMFGSLLLLGGAIFFSILHMVTRIYS